MTVDQIPALPGAVAEFSTSSVRLTADSQPQYMNTPSSSPPVRAAPAGAEGLSQVMDGSISSRVLVPA